MLSTKPLDIRPDHAEIVYKILKDNLEEGNYVFAFGSRANWTAKQSSDLDLAMDGFGMKLDKKIKSNLEDAFEESDLPYKVDVVDLNSVSESFREAIQDQLVRVLWDWEVIAISQISSRITSGGTPSKKKAEYFNGHIPWLNTTEVKNCRINKTNLFISELGLKNSSAKWIDEGSVIVAMYGATAGKVALSKIRLTTNQACCNITLDRAKANPNFIYYNLIGRYQDLVNLSSGAAQQNLNVSIISNFNITLPPLPEQKRIAEILSSLDNKIEINKQINKTLEEMAEALFKSWFIDFDPVRVKKAALEAGADEEGANLAVMKFISSKTDEELGNWGML